MIYDKNAVYLWEINFMTYMYLYSYSIDVIASSAPKTHHLTTLGCIL